jgi:MoaA/NifB/PqqE/SkfB family radical SAM enzyme
MQMWSTNKHHKLKVTMDVSTYCNAGCPQCTRTDPNGLGKIDWMPLVQWSSDQFKKAIKPEDFEYIGQISFVGSYGDCIMNKDIFEIVKYCIDHKCPVKIETNGSIRDEEWWWNFGVMGGELLQVRFDVDGIDQEMHSKYRRFTSLQKVLNNMLTFSQTKAKAATQTVVFKHNQDYLKEIEELCLQYGSLWHTKVISDRFYNTKTFEFINENGEKEVLEEADRNIFQKPYIVGAFQKVNQREIKSTEKIITQTIKIDKEKKETYKKQVELDTSIKCRWAMPMNSLYVMHDGSVIPCCYVGWFHTRVYNPDPKYDTKSKYKQTIMANSTFKHLIDSYDNISVFKHSIKEILQSEWYSKTLPESLSSDNPMPMCVMNCSNRVRKEHQLREDSQYDYR